MFQPIILPESLTGVVPDPVLQGPLGCGVEVPGGDHVGLTQRAVVSGTVNITVTQLNPAREVEGGDKFAVVIVQRGSHNSSSSR